MLPPTSRLAHCLLSLFVCASAGLSADDTLRDLQTRAIQSGRAEFGHWGPDRDNYKGWQTHSNRLIPVYTFGTKNGGPGVDLDSYTGANSAYRSEAALARIYGRVPTHTLNPAADYLDQTDLAALQRAAFAAGRKYVFLVVFDGMDWQTTWAAAIYSRKQVGYRSGRGTGTHFQDYTACGTTQFGFMVTTPHNEGTAVDVDSQELKNPGGKLPGGYNAQKAGANPWTPGDDPFYIISKSADAENRPREHAVPDSAATATALCSGMKTYNASINIDATGQQGPTVAREAQARGQAVGVVTSVPISHATPACAYANNVHRNDYQDLSRDLLGRPSIAHPRTPLPGVDVLLGGGFGDERKLDKGQGTNFVPGNAWITADDLHAIDVAHGGRYQVALRQKDVPGRERLLAAARTAADCGQRLFGLYGVPATKGNLPIATANGDFYPTIGAKSKEYRYTPEELRENPTLADMTAAALLVLERNPRGFWLMVEAGDVDWANHDNNLDASIGAVNCGDAAVKVITDWVECHSNWQESLMIVTADHGHYLVLEKPELLTGAAE